MMGAAHTHARLHVCMKRHPARRNCTQRHRDVVIQMVHLFLLQTPLLFVLTHCLTTKGNSIPSLSLYLSLSLSLCCLFISLVSISLSLLLSLLFSCSVRCLVCLLPVLKTVALL